MTKLIETKKKSLRYLRQKVKPCKRCGSNHIQFYNLNGWTNQSVKCVNCGNEVKAMDIEEAITKWNEQNAEE